MSESDAATPEDRLLEILENPEHRILPLLFKSTNPKDQQAKQETLSQLTGIAQDLFRKIEETAKKYHIISNQKSEEASEEKEQATFLLSQASRNCTFLNQMLLVST